MTLMSSGAERAMLAGSAGVDGMSPLANQAPSRDVRQPHVIVCPSCSKQFRWTSQESCKIRCRACGARLVVLVDRDGSCAALPENEDSVEEMFCDWLGGDLRDREDNEDEAAPLSDPDLSSPPKAAA